MYISHCKEFKSCPLSMLNSVAASKARRVMHDALKFEEVSFTTSLHVG